MGEKRVRRGVCVVSLTDAIEDCSCCWGWTDEARSGASRSSSAPALPRVVVLARPLAADRFDSVDEIHVAKFGTGGPACARQHHRALSGAALDWREQAWIRRRGGSGRELLWFPEPVAARDCYRAALADALLLVPSFPNATRITSRMSATRRDRLTARSDLRPRSPRSFGAVRES